MADPRFFRNVGPFSLTAVCGAAGLGLPEDGDGAQCLHDVAPIDTAGPADVTFLDGARYRDRLEACAAGVCLLKPAALSGAPAGLLCLPTPAPYRAYAHIARLFYPDENDVPVAETDVAVSLAPDADLGVGVRLGPGARVGAGAVIGAGSRIGANAAVGPGVVLGAGCAVGAGATVSHCLAGERVRILPGARIGGRGFGFDMTDFPYCDVPQLGRVVIGDDVEIGANTTIDRGAGPDTVIGDGSRLDNLVQIGHNVRLGRGCVLVAQAGIAGSTVLGDHVVVAAKAGVAGHLHIGEGARIGAAAGVMRDVAAGEKVAGTPAMPAKTFFRLVAAWQRLVNTKDKNR